MTTLIPNTIDRYLATYSKQDYPFSPVFFSFVNKPYLPVSVVFDIEIKMNDGKVFLFENKELKIR